jgi:2-polyprenyl-3-methyl-5-hydroxy-6-metoxy-1,4-benzoquinol methylase
MSEISTLSEHEQYTKVRKEHWNRVADSKEKVHRTGKAYHKRLEAIYSTIIPSGSRVLEIGCGEGDLLHSLKPGYGVGIDFSDGMIRKARSNYSDLRFEIMDAHLAGGLNEKFDYIILSDLINDLWDVQTVLSEISKLISPSTRIVLNIYSRLWVPILTAAEKLHLAVPTLEQNWLTIPDLHNILNLGGFELVKSWQEIIFPISIPILGSFLNNYLVRIWPFNIFALTNIHVARQVAIPADDKYKVTVIVPARNEEGNIPAIFDRVPSMGKASELIFVEGNSTDQTYTAIENEIPKHPNVDARLIKQPGKGKGDAVRAGFDIATGDILMILDADLTVLPEDLPRFYEALASSKGEFINGVRLVYPMDKEAMRFFNFLGNKFFSFAFSWLLGQPVKDTLCGTKVLWKKDYERIKAGRAYFGDFDPFGDFDLLFGAARLNLRIVDMPIRYHERTYGTTNISRWSHGWLLIKMLAFAARRLKFI